MKIIRVVVFTTAILLVTFIINLLSNKNLIGGSEIDNNFRERSLMTFVNQVLKPDFRLKKIYDFGKRVKNNESYIEYITKDAIDRKEATYGYVEDKNGKVLSKYLTIEIDSNTDREMKTIVKEFSKYFDMPEIGQSDWKVEEAITEITYKYVFPEVHGDKYEVMFAQTRSFTTGYTIILGACENTVSSIKPEGLCF